MTIEQARVTIEEEIASAGFTLKYAKSLRGRVRFRSKVCMIPPIKTRKSLYIACHELGHVIAGYVRPIYVGEYKAEQYAHVKMRELGFSVPRLSSVRAKEYVAMKIRGAKRRGLKSVSSPVKAWAGKIVLL